MDRDLVVIRLLLSQVMTFDRDRATASALVGSSTAIRDLQKEAELAARLDLRVLIGGEYGVGKKRLARLIHAESSRHRGPFVRIQCGRETEAPLQTRLFGVGGVSSPMTGAFARANGGAILLEDVDALTPSLQDALTNYLAMESPVSGRGRVDIQVLASTRVPLINKVLAGAFRDDLYYLLNTMYLPIPPLRERPEDVEPLLEHFTSHYARRYRIDRPRLTAEAHARCRSYGWPANVRELQTTAATLVAQSAQSLK